MKTPMNDWLLIKILSNLVAHDGFIIEKSDYTIEGMKAVVKDAFGYRYEINVSTLGRTHDDKRDSNDDFNAKKFNIEMVS